MKKSILLFSFTVALSLFAPSIQAENICEHRAKARRHTALSQARQAYLARVASCQTMPSPDRAEQCIQTALGTYERDSQAARARYAKDVRDCRTQS